MYTWDTTTFELTETRLRLKSGLRYTVQHSRHGQWYLVEDESRGTFFRIGPAEYTLLSFLDGKTTLSTAMAKTCSIMGASALDEQEAIQLCNWLIDTGLAHTDASISAQRIGARQIEANKQQAIQKLNPVSIRIPIWNPDKLVTHATKFLGWLLSWPFALIWLFVCCYAMICVAMDWERLVYGSAQVFTRNGMIWMIGTWLLLKVMHESAHAIACKRFGGKTGDFGILMLLFIPLPYVDVTSSWRFTDKYKRMLVAAAGMLAEMFVAAIAAIVWFNSGPGVVSFYASTVIFAASLHTLLFNANPLLKFDGYHILADWLELPNLGSHGQRFVNGKCRQFFLGLPAEKIKYAGVHGWIIRVYGVAALAWRILLCFVLGLAALNLFHGIGLIIALVATALWLFMPLGKFIRFMFAGTDSEQPDRIRFARNFGLLVGVFIIGMLSLPAPSIITAPVVVEYEGLGVIRNESAGFIETVSVAHDQWVEQGDVLLTLANDDLNTREISTRLELREAIIRANAQQSNGDIGAMQIELESVSALEKQLAEIEALKRNLAIKAPMKGRVIADEIESLVGKYVPAGTDLMSLGIDNKKSAIALISQDDARFIGNGHSQLVDVQIWGNGDVETGKLESINPGGQDQLPHFAFAGLYGGPIDVAQRSQIEDSDRALENELQNLMMVSSRVAATIKFDQESSNRLFAGQTGVVRLRGRSENLGGYLWNRTRRWLSRNLKRNHGL